MADEINAKTLIGKSIEPGIGIISEVFEQENILKLKAC